MIVLRPGIARIFGEKEKELDFVPLDSSSALHFRYCKLHNSLLESKICTIYAPRDHYITFSIRSRVLPSHPLTLPNVKLEYNYMYKKSFEIVLTKCLELVKTSFSEN